MVLSKFVQESRPQTYDLTPHFFKVYRQKEILSSINLLLWSVKIHVYPHSCLGFDLT